MKADVETYKKIYYSEDPINGELANELRSKLVKVYTEIRAKAHYVSNPNDSIRIHVDEKSDPYSLNHLPATLIITHLVNRASVLLDGSPGCGKTKTVKIVSRLMTGTSMRHMDNVIYCDEELTKEKWLATPDVKKMMARPGEMDEKNDDAFPVIWAPFFQDDYDGIDFVADEINRANPKTQSEFLSWMAEGLVQYSVSAKKDVQEFRMFMTRNPIDAKVGTSIYPLNFAFKDRITQSVRVYLPSSYSMKRVSDVRKDDRNYELTEDDEIKPIMTTGDVRNATILASKIPVTEMGERYARYIVRDASLCLSSPGYDKTQTQKQIGTSLCDGCHFNNVTNYHCQKYYGGSMRVYTDLLAVSKAYCFWLGISKVNEHVIKSVAIDVLSHRILIVPSMLERDKSVNDEREFLSNYLINWSFSKLQMRQATEEAYERLYDGTSTNPTKDQQLIILNAKNDIYILADLLPMVMRIEMEGNKMSPKEKITSSTDHSDYRIKAKEINNTMKDDEMDLNDKMKKLKEVYREIETEKIPFVTNLIDMIYAGFREIDEMKKKQMFKTGYKNEQDNRSR